jgi:hypothetical protein
LHCSRCTKDEDHMTAIFAATPAPFLRRVVAPLVAGAVGR